jgi:hypothetical protein
MTDRGHEHPINTLIFQCVRVVLYGLYHENREGFCGAVYEPSNIDGGLKGKDSITFLDVVIMTYVYDMREFVQASDNKELVLSNLISSGQFAAFMG